MAFAQQDVARIATVHQSYQDQFTAAVVIPEPLDSLAAGHQFQHAVGRDLGELGFSAALALAGCSGVSTPLSRHFVAVHQAGQLAFCTHCRLCIFRSPQRSRGATPRKGRNRSEATTPRQHLQPLLPLSSHLQHLAELPHHIGRDVLRKAEWSVATGAVPGASLAAAPPSCVAVVRAGAVAGIFRNAFLDHLVFKRRDGDLAVERLR